MYEDSKYEGKGGSVRPSNVQWDMQNLHVAAYSATSSHRKQMKGEYMIDTSAIKILWAARRLAVIWSSSDAFIKLTSIMVLHFLMLMLFLGSFRKHERIRVLPLLVSMGTQVRKTGVSWSELKMMLQMIRK